LAAAQASAAIRARHRQGRWASRSNSKIVFTEPGASALEQMQVTLATQLDDSLQVLLARALLALGPLPKIAIVRLSVPTSRHGLTSVVITDSALHRMTN
jgi:hypothetical protein